METLSNSTAREGSTRGAAIRYNSRFRPVVFSLRAEVAELADAQASGACCRKAVEVQILSSAPTFKISEKELGEAIRS
jgi:hypothetical protein